MFGWHHTGDIGYLDDENYLYIVDRKKDMIITGGFNVFATEVEGPILELNEVLECAVVGLPDEKWGERPYALITLKPGESISEQDIKQHLQQFVDSGDINKWAIPEQMRFVEDIPKTSVGKINKKLIRDQLKD